MSEANRIGATAGAKLGEGPFPFRTVSGATACGMRPMQQAVILSHRLRLTCAPQPQRPVRSAVTAHIRPLRSNAFRRDVLRHRPVLYKALADRPAHAVEFVLLTGCRVSIQNLGVHAAS